MRDFDFDPESHGQREEQLEKLQADMDSMRISLQHWCGASYGEVRPHSEPTQVGLIALSGLLKPLCELSSFKDRVGLSYKTNINLICHLSFWSADYLDSFSGKYSRKGILCLDRKRLLLLCLPAAYVDVFRRSI